MDNVKRRIVYKARSGGRGRRITAALLVTAAFILIFSSAVTNLRHIASEFALSTATDVITITVNDVINDKLRDGSLDYKNLVQLEKDGNGDITALITDMAGINRLQAEVTNAVVTKFGESDVTEVQVPLGNLFGGAIFSGKGPKIKIKMLSVTNVATQFRNEFSSAGINQTRHQILMDVNVELGILFAGRKDTDKVITSVSIAETVIVGSVPNMYAEMER